MRNLQRHVYMKRIIHWRDQIQKWVMKKFKQLLQLKKKKSTFIMRNLQRHMHVKRIIHRRDHIRKWVTNKSTLIMCYL